MQDYSAVLLQGNGVPHVLSVADKVLSKALELIHAGGRTDKTGGFLAWYFNGSPILAGVLWGELEQSRTINTQRTAAYKIECLMDHPKHSTSYRTRNPLAKVLVDGKMVLRPRWGGAIRAGAHILSFSGLPELWDEAAMFVLAIKLGWVGHRYVLSHISAKRNPHLRPLLEACHWTE